MEATLQFSVGQVVSFLYPAANYRGVRARFERRRLLVERIRDLAAEPLDPLTLQIDPLLDRGRLLVIGQDLDRRAERSFYADSMRLIPETPRPWLIVLDGEPARVVYEAEDAEEAASWAADWNSFPGARRAFVVARDRHAAA